MRVLVTGAGGFLGSCVVEALLKRGHYVRAIVRPASQEPKWTRAVQLFRADLRVHNNLQSAFDGIDAVIHLAAATTGNEDTQFTSTVIGTERLLEAMARSATKRLIHISSLVVYDWSRAKGVMDESSPLLSEIYSMGGYTIAKVWQERLVRRFALANAWKLTVMRPGFIWGARHAEIAGMGRRFGHFYLLFGPLTRLPLSHVANCADCIVLATENPAAIDQTFNVVDEDKVRVLRYVREYARRTGNRGLLLFFPYGMGLALAHLAFSLSRALFGTKGKLPSLLLPRRFQSQFKPLRFSNRKLQKVLGWTPPFAFDECLDLTYPAATGTPGKRE